MVDGGLGIVAGSGPLCGDAGGGLGGEGSGGG